MADTKEALTQKGYTAAEANEILRRATQLQHRAEQQASGLSHDSLEAGAAAAGIPKQFIEQAVQDIEAERKRLANRRARRRRWLVNSALGAAVFLLITAFYSYAALNNRLSTVEEKRAQLENVLQRRHDLIPNLIALAKTSASHEKELIHSVGEVYQKLSQPQDFERRQALEQRLSDELVKLLSALRANPDASSMALFIRLSDELAGAENRIAVERKRYNEAVAAYNRTARSFPVFLARPLLGFPKAFPPFRASEEARRPPEL